MRDSAFVNYHIKRTAPQAFHFDVDGVIGTLESPELAPTRIDVRDLRNNLGAVDFARDGIAFERHANRTTGSGHEHS